MTIQTPDVPVKSCLGNYLRFRNGKTSPERLDDEGYPVFGSNGPIGRCPGTNADGPLVVIGRVGSYCGSLFYSGNAAWVTDNAIICTAALPAETRYWYYALQTLSLNNRSGGSGQPLLNQSALASVEFQPSAPSERIAIAEVLGALDDKIAANTKLNDTIDEYLGTLFSAEVALCEDVTPLRELAQINAEAVKPVTGGSLRYIDIASVGIGRYDYPAASDWADAPRRARRRVRKGDVLWSTVRPNRRSHALNLSDDPSLVGSTGLAVLTPVTVGFAYLYEVSRLPAFTAFLESAAEGSAYPTVRAHRFGDAIVPWLSRSDRETFESIAAPMRWHAHSLESENRHLAAMREALLPQLMSGRVRVKDVKQMVGDVV